MPIGLPGFSPNLIQQQQRIAALPSDPQERALAQRLIQLTQQNKVGTPEYFMTAGEFQNRQKIRQQQQATQQKPPPVVAELTAQAAQKAAPATSGVAQLPVGGIGQIGNYAGAGGGIVAFESGGQVPRFQGAAGSVVRAPAAPIGFSTAMSGGPMDPQMQRAYYVSRGLPIPYELMTEEEKRRAVDPAQSARMRAAIDQIPGAPTPAAVQTATPVDVAQTRPVTPPAAAPAPGGSATIDKVGIASIAPPDYKRTMERAGEMTSGIMGQRPAVPTDAESVTAVRDIYKQAGVNLDLFKEQIAKLEEEGKSSKADKQEAMNMRLIEAGLGILGGESPYAFVNIGKGAAPALKGLQEDLKDLKKLERDRQKAIRDMQVAENQMAAGIGGEAAKRKADAEKRLDSYAEREAVLKNSVFSTMVSSETQREVANLSSRTSLAKDKSDRKDQNKLRAYQEANKEMMKRMQTNPLLAQDPVKYDEEFNTIYQRALQLIETGKLGEAPTSGSLVRNPDGTYTYKR